jgi:STE24 endopeptidase
MDESGQDDPLRQRQAHAYRRAGRRLAVADGVVNLVVLVAIVAAAGTLGGWGSVAALIILPTLASLPFGLVRYRLSRANGLSRQTTGGWLADRAKGLAVGLVLGIPAGLAVLGLQRAFPDWWPVPAWAGALLLSAALAVLFPVLLLPLFMKSRPLGAGPVADEVWGLVRRSGVDIREVRELLMSEKTSEANAMVAGMGPTRRVYVGDTLSEGEEDEQQALGELRVVLAHELGHQKHHDMWRLLGWSALSLGAGMACAWATVELLAPDGAGHLTALPALVLGFGIGSGVVSPAGNWYSRRRERAADLYAVELTGEGPLFAAAFERMVRANLAELRPPRLWYVLTASHPAPAERIALARNPSSKQDLH